MDDPPRFPAGAFIAWLAIVADGAALVWLLMSDAPLALKAVVVAVQATGCCAIVAYYLGRRQQWNAQRRDRDQGAGR
jgi:membrane glycosyltransferase